MVGQSVASKLSRRKVGDRPNDHRRRAFFLLNMMHDHEKAFQEAVKNV